MIKPLTLAFEREIYGRIPKSVPKVTWSVAETLTGTVGGRAVNGRQLVGRVDNASYPAISVEISLVVVTPAVAAGAADRVPLMIMFRGGTLKQALGLEPMTGFGGKPVVNVLLKFALILALPWLLLVASTLNLG